MIARHTRSGQLVLRVLLDFAGGKAVCWPANETIVGIVGLKERAVQYILRDLEAAGTIRCIKDESLKTRRRIVMLNHPGTKDALKGATESTTPTKGCKRRVHVVRMEPHSGAPESLEPKNEEKPVAGSADQGPAGEQAEDWLARMSPALRARFQGAIDELSKDS